MKLHFDMFIFNILYVIIPVILHTITTNNDYDANCFWVEGVLRLFCYSLDSINL